MIRKHRPGGGQARGGSKPKLSHRLSYYRYRYAHMNIFVAPLVCAYCNSPMIAFEMLAKSLKAIMGFSDALRSYRI